MKKSILALLILVLARPAFAENRMESRWDRWADRREYRPFLQEMQEILQPVAGEPIGSLTLDRLHQLALDLSVPAQKIIFIERSRTASFLLPGAGQFMNKEPVSGALFLLSSLAVTAGTIVGGYLLLPEDLQFDHLNYYREDFSTIEARVKAHSLRDYLPTIGVAAGGCLTGLVLRGFSAAHAGRLARRNIAAGGITFQPRLLFPVFGYGPPGSSSGASHGPRLGLMGGWGY
jgi:hypothetical protein